MVLLCRLRLAQLPVAFTLLQKTLKTTMRAGERVILVRLETSPEDIEGMQCGRGYSDGSGGMTSHAAVVARGMGYLLRIRLW